MKATDEKPEPKRLVEDVRGFELSADRKRVLVVREKELLVLEASPTPPEKEALQKARLDLSGWRFSIDPREDWRQIFIDAWRLERDYTERTDEPLRRCQTGAELDASTPGR